MKRWQFMEQQTELEEHYKQVQRSKNLVGQKSNSSKAYNILNQQYENNVNGSML
jgi:hypothetical protein